jgi:NAD+ kinase
MLEKTDVDNYDFDVNNSMIEDGQRLHIRWNSQRGKIFIDGSHLTHNLELGDEIMIDNHAPPLKIFTADEMTLDA